MLTHSKRRLSAMVDQVEGTLISYLVKLKEINRRTFRDKRPPCPLVRFNFEARSGRKAFAA